jgi:hypothetical protein
VFTKAFLSRFFDLEEMARSFQDESYSANAQYQDYAEFANEMIVTEYANFLGLAKRHDAFPVFLSYATAAGPKEEIMNDFVANLANKRSVPYLLFPQPQTFLAFKEQQMLAPRGHPNAQGYERVARAVYNFLIDHYPPMQKCAPAPWPTDLPMPFEKGLEDSADDKKDSSHISVSF